MLIIEDNVIKLTRGDDAVIGVDVTANDGSTYSMAEGDTLTLTVRELPDPTSAVLMLCKSTSGSNRIIVNHADSADVAAGRYSADIQLTTADGKRYTVWPEPEGSSQYTNKNLMNFYLMPEVTTV